MGIKYLNKFLKNETNDSIQLTNMRELSGKKIAIDISVYLYKFAADNSLIENMYSLLSLFNHYHIIPIFIFDGKPPPEKKELLEKRRKDKKEAEFEYNKLKKQLYDLSNNLDECDKQDIITNMDLLKKQFVYINKNDIQKVKNMIRCFGATYYDSPGEADELCAYLAIKNKVWAVLSEDMDMFVYGVPRILRYFSLLNHTVVLYDLEGILQELGISHKELREICVLSGTDYNINLVKLDNNNFVSYDNNSSLYKTLNYYKQYYRYTKNLNIQDKSQLDFYIWLCKNTNYIENYELLMKIYNIFDLTNESHIHLKKFENIKIQNGPLFKEEIKSIMREDGFLFCE